MAPPAVIEVSFVPVVELAGLAIRWQTIGITVALLAALALAARIAGYLPPRSGQPVGVDRLRLDDMGYIVLGIVPGAVIGGRIAHGLVFWPAYAADPLRLLDPGVGSLSLLGALIGGTLSGAYLARLLALSHRRVADAAAVPLLLAVGLGKLAQFLGGSGQGAPFDGRWAVAFVGAGPWHSLHAEVPAHPAQVYEGLWALAGIPLLLLLFGPGRDLGRVLPRGLRWLRREVHDRGTLFAGALAWFFLGRVLIGFTWRDQVVVGRLLNAEQALALVALGALAAIVLLLIGRGARRARRAGREPRRGQVDGQPAA